MIISPHMALITFGQFFSALSHISVLKGLLPRELTENTDPINLVDKVGIKQALHAQAGSLAMLNQLNSATELKIKPDSAIELLSFRIENTTGQKQLKSFGQLIYVDGKEFFIELDLTKTPVFVTVRKNQGQDDETCFPQIPNALFNPKVINFMKDLVKKASEEAKLDLPDNEYSPIKQ